MPNWSVKAEYLYYNLGKVTNDLVPTSYIASGNNAGAANLLSSQSSTSFNGHIVRAGLNYHFNWGVAAIASKNADENDDSPEQSAEASYLVPTITKIEGFGGALTEGWPEHQWVGQGGVIGSVFVPFNENYAVQFDAQLAGANASFVPGLAGHAYWFDSKKGLMGFYGSGEYDSGNSGQGDLKLAGEGAYFMDKFTVQGLVGIETQSFVGSRPAYNCQAYAGIGCEIGYVPNVGLGLFDAYGNLQPNFGRRFTQPTSFFDHVELDYYALDDLKLSLAHEYTGAINSAVLGAEYLFRTGNGIAPAIFVEGSIGEHGTGSIVAGLRFYFGQEGDKTLIRRQREDDPTTSPSAQPQHICQPRLPARSRQQQLQWAGGSDLFTPLPRIR